MVHVPEPLSVYFSVLSKSSRLWPGLHTTQLPFLVWETKKKKMTKGWLTGTVAGQLKYTTHHRNNRPLIQLSKIQSGETTKAVV